MAYSRLQLYQDALLLCRERFIASLSENVESRRLLDNVWASNGIRRCLEEGQWQFAMRTAMIDADPDSTTEFGYTNVFNKPTDWVLTSALCSDERFTTPLTAYTDEVSSWVADITPIYVKYVSDDTDFGANMALWPATFCNYVAAYFASQVVSKLTADDKIRDDILNPRTGVLERTKLVAKSRAMMTQGTRFSATGSWIRARRAAGRGGAGPMGDGGTSGSLTG